MLILVIQNGRKSRVRSPRITTKPGNNSGKLHKIYNLFSACARYYDSSIP